MLAALVATIALGVFLVASARGDEASAQGPEKLGPMLRMLVAAPGPRDAPADSGAFSAAEDLFGPPFSDAARARLAALGLLIAIDARAATPTVDVLIETSGSDAEIAGTGARVIARVGDIVAASVPVTSLTALADLGSVSRVEAARVLEPVNDLAVVASGADLVHDTLGLDGSGVVVATIDSGIDIYHDDFRNPDGTTRVKALLDVTAAGSECGGDATAYTEAQINAELAAGDGSVVPQRDFNGHGTHVAGCVRFESPQRREQ
jgi:subtilisin family serine protease